MVGPFGAGRKISDGPKGGHAQNRLRISLSKIEPTLPAPKDLKGDADVLSSLKDTRFPMSPRQATPI